MTGIAHLGDAKALGRIGLKTMSWFLIASFLSLALGLLTVNLLEPGAGLNLPLPEESAPSSGVASAPPGFAQFIVHTFPDSMVGAMASNAMARL